MNFTQKVWSITDLIRVIGSFKKMFEHASDIEKLNESTSFQHLVWHVFARIYDSSLIVRHNTERLRISICKHRRPMVIVTFEILEKRKRTPFYFNILFLNSNESALTNQRKLAERVLYDSLLLPFFYNDSKTECKV